MIMIIVYSGKSVDDVWNWPKCANGLSCLASNLPKITIRGWYVRYNKNL